MEGKKETNNRRNDHRVTNMVNANIITLIITLNMNGQNILIKRHRLSEWIKKELYAVDKKFALNSKTQKDEKDGEKHSTLILIIRKQESLHRPWFTLSQL